MSSSRIEQIIEEIEEYIEGCRYQPLSTTKIIVNKEELEELLRELRLKTPDEIKRYQKIIGNRDAILADAQSKAQNIIEDAQNQAKQLTSETEVMKAAYSQANDTVNEANRQAQDILDSAQEDANNIRVSAISYTDELLQNLSGIMTNTLSEVGGKYNDFVNALQSYNDVVNSNRAELAPIENAAGDQNAAEQQESAPEEGGDEKAAPEESAGSEKTAPKEPDDADDYDDDDDFMDDDDE